MIQRVAHSWKSLTMMQALAIVLLAALSGMAGLWVADRSPPVVVIDATPVERVVSPGGVLKVRYDVERYRSCAVKIDRVVLDAEHVRLNLDDLDFAGSPGPMGRDTFTVDVPVPRVFAQGPALYRVLSRYECNLVHRLWPIVTMREISFEVRGYPVTQSTARDLAPLRP